ncbi:MAG: GntR family transcriptional regulator, partial [Alcanivoracaceae bacterium]|nr:GntR family transcriptional regulator [Alcanivoracaceae bacterium]
RLVASIKLSKHLNELNSSFKARDEVNLLICGKSKLGFKAVINETHLGLIHHSDVFKTIRLGQNTKGYIKEIREDKKINLCFNLPDSQQQGGLAVKILTDLKQNGGVSSMTDKSPPAEIYQKWNVSKGSYKKALGSLYKQKLITINKEQIKLAE